MWLQAQCADSIYSTVCCVDPIYARFSKICPLLVKILYITVLVPPWRKVCVFRKNVS